MRHVYLLAALATCSIGLANAQTTTGTQPQGAQNTANPANPATPAAKKPVRQQPATQEATPTAGKPDCSAKKGLEKSECERRDTSRDDLPAGVTATQPSKPPQ